MHKYIISFGWSGECAIYFAPNLDAAKAKAAALSMAEGYDLADCCWAEPYDPLLARDVGLIWLDEQERYWESAEPRT